jgi:methionyl-tRNA synthetase
LTEAEPWKMKGDENAIRRQAIVRTSLEAVYAFMHFLAPVIPMAAQKVFDCLNTEPKSLHNLKNDLYNLVPGTPITVGDILFQKILTETEKPAVIVAEKPAKQPKQPKKTGTTEKK